MAEITVPVPAWKQARPWLWRALLVALALYVAYLVREIWLPLSIAFLVALILDPVVDRLEMRGFTRAAGAALIFGTFILVTGGLLFVSVPPLLDQGAEIQQRFEKVLPDHSSDGIDRALEKQHAAPLLRSIVKQLVANLNSSLSKSSNLVTDRLIQYGSNLIWLVIVPIVAYYALRDFHLILGKALLLVRSERRANVQTAVAEVTAIFARYMRGLAIVSLLNGLATWLLLAVLGVPSPMVLGAAAGILYSVPYLGALITVALVCGVAFLSGGFNFMLIVLVANLLLHQVIFDQIVTPRIVGGQVGIHPILAIVALLAGNALLGLAGMILAVPIAACLQIGVLSLVPKLGHEIDLPPPENHVEAKGQVEGGELDAKIDATEELHQTVVDAVEQIEEGIREAESELPKAPDPGTYLASESDR